MVYDIVLDTNVVVSGLRSRLGASYRILRLIADERVRLHLSVALVFEYESVVKRPQVRVPFSMGEIDTFLDDLCATGHNDAIFFRWRPQLRDPGDDLVLDVAIAGRCQYIITHNIRDFAGSDRFGIQAITPGHFLRILGELRMSTVSIDLPDSLYAKAQELAERAGIPVDRFLASFTAEKLAELPSERYFEERAARGSRESLRRILDRVPHVPPDPGDEL